MKKNDVLMKIKSDIEELGNKAELVAVSKNHTYKEIEEVYDCGQKVFGENRVQEILEKFPEKLPEGMKLHLIGHLQTNKVSKVISKVNMIESVDSLKLAKKINDECKKNNTVMPILFEINTSGEESKTGYDEKTFFQELHKLMDLTNLDVRGFMTIGPLSDDEKKVRESFRQLVNIQLECRKLFPDQSFDTLSMGMSADYKIALEEGSTEIRVGTAIFGKRNYA